MLYRKVSIEIWIGCLLIAWVLVRDHRGKQVGVWVRSFWIVFLEFHLWWGILQLFIRSWGFYLFGLFIQNLWRIFCTGNLWKFNPKVILTQKRHIWQTFPIEFFYICSPSPHFQVQISWVGNRKPIQVPICQWNVWRLFLWRQDYWEKIEGGRNLWGRVLWYLRGRLWIIRWRGFIIWLLFYRVASSVRVLNRK